MNDTSPLPPEALDELLSADLDGDLDAAAAALGLEPAAARARLAATPVAPDRRDALARARAEIAAVPALDELLAARLRAKAVRAAKAEHDRDRAGTMQRRQRALAAVSSAAAALLVVAGVAFALARGDSGDQTRTSGATLPTPDRGAEALERPGADTGAPATATTRHDFGAVDTVSELAPLVREQLAQKLTRTARPQPTSPESGGEAPAVLDAAGSCAAAARDFAGVEAGDGPQLLGDARVAGQPVLVYLFEPTGSERAAVAVVLTTDCRLVSRITAAG
jgi:hypothetical protein